MNKTIWIYWHQGWENAPQICKKCLSTWILLNPEWNVEPLCSQTIGNFINLKNIISGIQNKEISLAALSDVIRVTLLKKFGGLWVDSTVICRKPLAKWLQPMVTNGFWAFSKPYADRMVSSWFLYADKESYIINAWYNKAIAFLKDKEPTQNYYWFHYLFNELYDTDELFKQLWDNTPVILAREPHLFIPYREKFFFPIEESSIKMIEKLSTPVFKLTHKYDHNMDYRNTLLEYLLHLT